MTPLHLSYLVSICKAEHSGLIQIGCSIQICSIWYILSSKCMSNKIGEHDLAWNRNDVISLLICLVCFGGVWKSQYIEKKAVIVQKVVQLFKSHYDKKLLTKQLLCEVSLYLERGNRIVSIVFSFIIVTL